MARFAREEVEPHVTELVTSMLRSIRQETTEREAAKALRGMFNTGVYTVKLT